MGITIYAFQHGILIGQSFDRYAIHIDEEANAALYGVAVKPGCVVEGIQTGVKRPWFQRYFEKMSLPPDVAHTTLEPRDLPFAPTGIARPVDVPARSEAPPKPEAPPKRGLGR
jgi:hypothetical protein